MWLDLWKIVGPLTLGLQDKRAVGLWDTIVWYMSFTSILESKSCFDTSCMASWYAPHLHRDSYPLAVDVSTALSAHVSYWHVHTHIQTHMHTSTAAFLSPIVCVCVCAPKTCVCVCVCAPACWMQKIQSLIYACAVARDQGQATFHGAICVRACVCVCGGCLTAGRSSPPPPPFVFTTIQIIRFLRICTDVIWILKRPKVEIMLTKHRYYLAVYLSR